ncbi:MULTISPECIES: flagellar protein export ATPase FliI [unclassified Candidatus Frackibacter]|uniref:flagellar protein export ATPase FliI n=1 Tax=unclassified Candidatus Frackibacter TaxID=2648818 RepID=UPI00088E251E|nr:MULTISPECIES: flagellar protein export ATPase FliI [unclassified Candidatus Frackibacter]SDB99643.1 type III secretion system ATPase, FliI/YscN [Candidatus Frackibacter sp. WG11]SEM31275.1 type III secretion system ATPase, FliI/YscN [Candidatus Frackibacter sp. WG12]SFL36220.1 type III secretion system ATPase, FliI/YscN [Candidatus Frackibacter sp. WG13]
MGKLLDGTKLAAELETMSPINNFGKIRRVIGLIIESQGPNVTLGEICLIKSQFNSEPVQAEVVGFKDNKVLLMPLGEMEGIGPGCRVEATGKSLKVKVGEELLGHVLDGLGKPLTDLNLDELTTEYSAHNTPPDPLTRQRITTPLPVGIRSIDGLLTCGRGQRLGIFAGSGVGKSTLLGMIARNTEADINVIGLIGERGREVREFIEKDLGEEGLARSVVVAATSDQPALVRLKGALVATAIAEYFRDQGKDVMLMMDSVTRFAMAQREVGLAVGEPPATRGYTPSVFATLPKLLERAGTNEVGTITGLYTVLVEGDDMNEPIADAVRGILDGHIALSRDLASQNHYPAIDVLESVSRVMNDIITKEHQEAAKQLKETLATYEESKDLVSIGAYEEGTNPKLDYALTKLDEINNFLRQGIDEDTGYQNGIEELKSIFK